MRKFYRVGSLDSKRGLWYTSEGVHTGHIHHKFDFCTNSKLEMDFDPEVVGFLSAAETLEDMFEWFTKEDVLELQKHNYFIFEYEVTDYKWYTRFQHWLIDQKTSKPVKQIILL